MFLNLERDTNSKYIYQQIYDKLKENILSGILKSNEKLPSKRKLADQLMVSVNTITVAYEQLLAEGYIYTKERKGYYVEMITQFSNEGIMEYEVLPHDLKESIHDESGWVSLSHMTADLSLFSFNEWIKCEQTAIKNHKKALSTLPHIQGPYIVRQTISRMIAMSRGVVCEPEQIVIGASTQLLVRNLMDIKHHRTVAAVENPGYSRFYTLLKHMGFSVRPLHLDEKGIAIDKNKEVLQATNFLFVTPSHQFPTGIIMPIARRIQLLNWSIQAPDRYIIEDDYDSEFKYETDHIPSLQSLDSNQRTIYTGTFSKTILPGLRISYMVLPPDILRAYLKHHDDFQSSNVLALYTLHYFIETGAYARHIKRMTHHYEGRRKQLMKHMQQQFGDQVVIDDIPAGLHFLARFKTNKTYEAIEAAAKKEKLEIYTMRRFMLEGTFADSGTIDLVLGFANVQEEQIPEAVGRLLRIFA